MSIEFVLGGARSGKSSYAEQLAQQSSLPVTYIATATVEDDEMAQRIAHHQSSRPAHWKVIEEPLYLASVIKQQAQRGQCIVVDCLTLWLTNCLLNENIDWQQEKADLLDVLNKAEGVVILVSNEVGQGIVPLGELTRQFVDEAGWLHQQVAANSDRFVFVTAGISQVLKSPSLND
ncbi:MAG: bifunctional adenosylcobinamide kinase/adenosylcobinamide-phosphate guanylyltransferase [Aliivibrio sp.]|uniref:bifunctional adenosylcobinamide kinase/adenosylcobinamide-phosphate guanylyltransferase n=1 Tax=Aliivibrio sp. TaxID=1872443 RepID=UPI001A45517F|nr:bifunctional adenosylcobinamide kinase/adenosylcobinamide-phosphate guanylyltransferase [Aliivibrio sp.]